jgi:hypothetical protein
LGMCHCGRPSACTTGECHRCYKGLEATQVYTYKGREMCGSCDSSDRMIYTRGPDHKFWCCKDCWFRITGENVRLFS